MATRRLVQRSRQNEDSSPAPRSRQQPTNSDRQRPGQQTPLPPYEAPSCPLNAKARRELEQLSINYDYGKYTLTLKGCKTNLITTTADVFERAKLKRDDAAKHTARRRKAGGNENEKTEQEIEALKGADVLEEKAQEIRRLAEKAIRDVIDLEDELAMNETLLKDAINKIPPPPEPQRVQNPRARERGDDEGEDDEVSEAQEEVVYEVPDVAGVSAMELLSQERQAYLENYQAKSLRQRYITSSSHGLNHNLADLSQDMRIQTMQTSFGRFTQVNTETMCRFLMLAHGLMTKDPRHKRVRINVRQTLMKIPMKMSLYLEPLPL